MADVSHNIKLQKCFHRYILHITFSAPCDKLARKGMHSAGLINRDSCRLSVGTQDTYRNGVVQRSSVIRIRNRNVGVSGNKPVTGRDRLLTYSKLNLWTASTCFSARNSPDRWVKCTACGQSGSGLSIPLSGGSSFLEDVYKGTGANTLLVASRTD